VQAGTSRVAGTGNLPRDASADRLRQEVRRRRSAERQLRREHDFVRTILDSTSAPILVIDLEGRVVRFNKACERASGYSEEEVLGRPIWDLGLIPDEEVDAVHDVPRQVISAKPMRGALADSVVRHENRWIHRDGSERLFMWMNAPLRDDDGVVRHIVASAVDVTQASRTRAALQAEHDLLEAILETVPAVIMVSDRKGRVLRFNRAAQESTGYKAREVRGKPIFDRVLPPEDRAGARALFERILDGVFPITAETEWLHRDGRRRQLSWITSALTDPAGRVTHVISAAVDVTGRNEADAREKARLEDLAHLHRLQTAGELAAVLAHELNQPLAAISSYSSAGEKAACGDGEESASQREVFRKIGRVALRAGQIIKDLRAFVGHSNAEATAFDASEALRAACALMQGFARRRGIAIELDLQEVAPVRADPMHVEQIVVNLIRNAVDAIGGADMRDGRITIRLRKVAGLARISVLDTGPGVPAAEAEKVFEPFYSSKPDGLGMGLRISRSLAQANAGRLWVGRGRRGGVFHLSLPFAR